MIGKTILHYKILEKLGEGGMGVVYLAEDNKLKRQVAIKFLPGHIAAHSDERKRFEIEAQAAAALNHPNIATIYAIEETNDNLFLVMEYIAGKHLKDHVGARHVVSLPEALDIAVQIAKGLQAAHNKGIVHRDIKASNIMITGDGQVKIMDFGLAKFRGSAQLTQIGTTVGTAAYMSPEQARGEEADQRSDLWSLGVVLYEMLTGELPFKGEYDQAVIYSIINENPEINFGPGIPRWLRKILQKTLEKDPAQRFQNTDDLIEAMKARNQAVNSRLNNQIAKVFYFLRFKSVAISVFILILFVASLYYFMVLEEPLDTLAILPMINQSGDKDTEYLTDGIAETLIFKLSQLPDLKVRSLSSVLRYKGKAPDLNKVGREMKVRAVLSGRIALRNDELVIVVELVDTDDNSTIWGETYKSSFADIIAVQDEISNKILRHLQLELSGTDLKKVDKNLTDNTDAYRAYLKGRYFAQNRTEKNLEKAIQYYQQSIDMEPGYAIAYAGLSQAYFLLGVYGFLPRDEAMPLVKETAERALEIDESLSEAHVALSLVYSHYIWDFLAAEKELIRARELNPNNANVHHHYSYLLIFTGQHEAAIQGAISGLELEPLSALMTRGVAIAYFFSGQYDQALKYYQDCLRTNPNSLSAVFFLTFVYYHLGMPDKSIRMLEKYNNLMGADSLAEQLSRTYKHSGYPAAIKELLTEKVSGLLSDDAQKAYLYAMIGEKDLSLKNLQRAYQNKSLSLTWVKVHPALETVRSDPRFTEIFDLIFEQNN